MQLKRNGQNHLLNFQASSDPINFNQGHVNWQKNFSRDIFKQKLITFILSPLVTSFN